MQDLKLPVSLGPKSEDAEHTLHKARKPYNTATLQGSGQCQPRMEEFLWQVIYDVSQVTEDF